MPNWQSQIKRNFDVPRLCKKLVGWRRFGSEQYNAGAVDRSGSARTPSAFRLYCSTARFWPRPKWVGPELNRRHMDFQSIALPTELPTRGILDSMSEALFCKSQDR